MADVLVLGAGIAGISACYHAQQAGLEAVCFEAASHPGGLVSNFEVQGFRFDNAVHLSFSKSDYVNSLFMKTPHHVHTPSPYCFDQGLWLKHPVQNNLYPLPAEERVACIESFIKRPEGAVENYQQWLIQQYGEVIAERYPLRYTQKYWGLPAEQLSLNWIGDRMRRAELKEILQGALEQRQDNHYYASQMRYPKQGGYFEFIRPLTEAIQIRCNKKAVSVDPGNKIVTFSDGTTQSYKSLINTLPLPRLVEMLSCCPETIKDAARSLLWTRVDLVSVGLKQTQVPPYLWFYIYDQHQYAARAYSPSLKAPSNAPQGCSSLQFEIYSLSGTPSPDPQALIRNVKQSLQQMKIADETSIIFCHHKQLPFGNVIFDHGMEIRRDQILQYLKMVPIYSAGRFGCWDYFWSDQSFLSGRDALQNLLDDRKNSRY